MLEVHGTMDHLGYNKGMLVSLNGFTKGVYDFVEGKDILLVQVEDLIEMSN